jgi:hypothetical protein
MINLLNNVKYLIILKIKFINLWIFTFIKEFIFLLYNNFFFSYLRKKKKIFKSPDLQIYRSQKISLISIILRVTGFISIFKIFFFF